METKYVRVPFELELAKEISNGSKDGRIVTKEGCIVRIICWDRKDENYPIVALVSYNSGIEGCESYTKNGNYLDDDTDMLDLMLEIPEYMTFKDGDVIAYGNFDGELNIAVFREYSYTSHKGYVSLGFYTHTLTYDYDNYTLNNSRKATEAEKQELIEALKASKDPQAKKCLKKLGIEVKREYEFKPFDKVLVRQSESDNWEAMLFSNYTDKPHRYRCLGMNYMYCVKYEGNEHLLGTNKSE